MKDLQISYRLECHLKRWATIGQEFSAADVMIFAEGDKWFTEIHARIIENHERYGLYPYAALVHGSIFGKLARYWWLLYGDGIDGRADFNAINILNVSVKPVSPKILGDEITFLYKPEDLFLNGMFSRDIHPAEYVNKFDDLKKEDE